jgi:hypothetical protein
MHVARCEAHEEKRSDAGEADDRRASRNASDRRKFATSRRRARLRGALTRAAAMRSHSPDD